MSRHCSWLALALAMISLAGEAVAAEDSLLLATTTSVRDSGLLDELLPEFQERSGFRVLVVAVGTGAALRMGAEGNADLLLTHAPASEAKLVASGAVTGRRPFMENYFVLAGPADDPAGVREAETPEAALQRIAALPAAFVSRADDSGTHKREVALLRAAGLSQTGDWEGFAKTGTSMGLTLQVAGERDAYVLSDIGTFLAFRERIGLVALSVPSDSLRNVYSLLPVNPERFPRVNARAARAFEEFLLEAATLERIADFGRARFGRPLFVPLRPAVVETRD